ncbi:hypothetical protein LJB98_05900, partial [Bacteroidales bacterium OttesenSCG-928-M11]|nr:hypothetical protein [Bacteroidales bacterium OttesenSCG-928-M11]
MKKVFVIISLLLSLYACSEDKVDYGFGEYYEELATCVSDHTFLLDDGTYLIAENIDPKYTNINEGDRFYLMFSFLERDIQAKERTIKIHSLSK